jgi:hypothetical protein
MQNVSVHDNSLISYEVLCREREIHLHTAFLDREPHQYTDVIFQSVAAYHFVGDNFNTIISNIDEVDVERIYSEYEELFVESMDFVWPMLYESKEELLGKMKDENVRGFIIHSSYGMAGWVWAESMRIEVKDIGAAESNKGMQRTRN